MTRLPRNIISALLTLLALSSCFVIDDSLMNGLVSGKWLWFDAAVLPALLCCSIVLMLRREAIRLTWTDIGVIVLTGYLIICSLFTQPASGDVSHRYIVVLGFWLFFRLILCNPKHIKGAIAIYLVVVASQTLIGLLQLYGFLPSHHSQFVISGSFHNPGPFSGFVVSGLPMALCVYFITKNNTKEWHKRVLQELKKTANSIQGEKSRWWGIRNHLATLVSAIKQLNSKVAFNYFSQLILLLLLLALPAARSRAAWLAALAGCAFVVYQLGFLGFVLKSSKLLGKHKGRAKKLVIGITAVILLFGGFYGLYRFKQGSADGRLLMWQVSWEMIKDKPLTGWGARGFEAHYSNYQANWFASGSGTTEQELLAGTPDAPFNEFIRITVSYGFIGLVLVALVLISVYYSTNRTFNSKQSGNNEHKIPNSELEMVLKAGVLAIITFSLFSYPLDVAPIVMQLIILIALITNLNTQNSGRFNPLPKAQYPKLLNSKTIPPKGLTWLAALGALIVIPFFGHHTYKQYKGYKHWKEAYQLYKYQLYDDAAEEYKVAKEYLPQNGLLLQVYGKCLAMGNQWEQANQILEQAKKLRSDPILFTTLGDVYSALSEYDRAESSYLLAWQMVPHKFYPKYQLAKLYVEKGDIDKAKNVAVELLEKEVKVESKAISEIKEYLNQIISSNEK